VHSSAHSGENLPPIGSVRLNRIEISARLDDHVRHLIQLVIYASLLTTVGSALFVYPHELAYFNEMSGGINNGHRHLVHSNLDWGQGLVELERLLDDHPEWGPVAIAYSGPFDPLVVGSRAIPIDWNRQGSPIAGFSHVAISANILAGDPKATHWYLRPAPFAPEFEHFFRGEEPVVIVDGSILLFSADSFNRFYSKAHTPHLAEPDVEVAAHPGWTKLYKLPKVSDAWRADRRSVSTSLHMLLLSNACPECANILMSGPEAFRQLTDERLAKAVFEKSPFIRTRDGIRYRLSRRAPSGDGIGLGESHRDQCLGTFATLGYPLDEPLTLESGAYTIRDLLNESVANFTLEQDELSWTAQAYVCYLVPSKSWRDRFGRTTTFSMLARYMMDHGFRQQSCAGLHVLSALVDIVQADNRCGILDRQTRIDARAFLRETMDCLPRTQRDDGSWDENWARSAAPAPLRSSLQSQLIVTGHLLELLHKLQPAPPPELIGRPTKWLLLKLPTIDLKQNGIQLCPLTHAIRAINVSFEHRASSFELESVFSLSNRGEVR
jgi:hypothetical protein